MRYLVTGGAGFVGAALVRALVDTGHEVQVLDNMSRGRPERLGGLGCRISQGDVRFPDSVARAMHGCDRVIHAAYIQGTQTFYAEPREVLDVAVRGMNSVLAACQATGCTELMLISSSETYQAPLVVPTPEDVPLVVPDVTNPRYSYGGGKIICELMALAWLRTGILSRVLIARPHNIYGPDMGREHVIPEFCLRMNQLIMSCPAAGPSSVFRFPIQGTGEETRSFCYIDDCIDQLILLLGNDTPDGVYNVGVRDERTIADVAHEVAACYGREIKVVPGTLAKGSPQRRCPDTAKIAALGYPGPDFSFENGLARTVAWYREHS
jgi:nucleoside-diphosphate-sugar epimerase